jgi:hypothetical protein
MTHVAHDTMLDRSQVQSSRRRSSNAERRAALHEAGSCSVYAGLRTITPFFQALLSDRHRIAGLLGGYAAETLHGFEVDLDAGIEQAKQRLDTPAADDLGRAYRIALRLVGSRARGKEQRHQLAARRIHEMWKKTLSYLTQPKVAACASRHGTLRTRDTWRLIQGAPNFDAAITRRIERDRQARDAASKRADLAEQELLQWDQARLEGAA